MTINTLNVVPDESAELTSAPRAARAEVTWAAPLMTECVRAVLRNLSRPSAFAYFNNSLQQGLMLKRIHKIAILIWRILGLKHFGIVKVD